MNFKLIYVDDERDDRRLMEDAVVEHNKIGQEPRIVLLSTADPESLRDLLDAEVDLVIADVYWRAENRERLGEVIAAVKQASEDHGLPSTIPVVALTSRGPATLSACLKYGDDLFDIWGKDSTTSQYRIWRLTQLAKELARFRPDTLIHRLVRNVAGGARWHNHVLNLSTAYQRGKTELDVIKRAGSAVGDIATELRVWEFTAGPLWEVMVQWEALSRAVSPSVRGHARHVINVFWLGYYLIHHEMLSPWFSSAWTELLSRRKTVATAAIEKNTEDAQAGRALRNLELAQALPPLESLSDSWYFAGLFHDSAGCVQKYSTARKAMDGLFNKFSSLVGPAVPYQKWPTEKLEARADELMSLYSRPAMDALRPLWTASLEKGDPDHGVVAGVYLRETVLEPQQRQNAEEAALAMGVHNLISDLEPQTRDLVTWKQEPLICLLLLCDQIQAWDRDRADETVFGPDAPDRAQLAALSVSQKDSKPHISITIDYIAPRHVLRSAELSERVKLKLSAVLKDKPYRALRRIGSPWPFSVEVDCRLSGSPLSVTMKFP